jgi:hypothetical protein
MLIRAEGRIYQVIAENDYFGMLIMKKRIKGMIVPLAFSLKGEFKRICCDKKEMTEGDKVRIWFVPVCRKHNEKYYTNLVIEKMEILEKNAKNLLNWKDSYEVDEDTGEVIDTETGEVIK